MSLNTCSVYSARLPFILLLPLGTKLYKKFSETINKPQGKELKAKMSNIFSVLGNLHFFIVGTLTLVKTFLSISLDIDHLFLPFQITAFLVTVKITEVSKLHKNFPYSPSPHSSNLPNFFFFHLTCMPIQHHESES